MPDRCVHGLVHYIFCIKCYINKHGEPESFDVWVRRVTKMRPATEEERNQLWLEAEAWMQKTPAARKFKRWRWDAKSVLAEYLANQRRITMFGLDDVDPKRYPSTYALLSEEE